ncbi:MAG: acyl carrier protein [Planctomycetes bacterium]|nr:acyl carrier protein [Planctomycetota bacterium]
MTTDEIRGQVVQALGQVAPEADLTRLRGDVPFRDQLDIDSMDFLNFLIGVDRRLGVAIPEADYPRLETLDDLVAYLARALAGR